jgi:hypothetical protein
MMGFAGLAVLAFHANHIRGRQRHLGIVRVADRVAVARLFAADFTCECHFCFAPNWGVFEKRKTLCYQRIPQRRKQFAAQVAEEQEKAPSPREGDGAE